MRPDKDVERARIQFMKRVGARTLYECTTEMLRRGGYKTTMSKREKIEWFRKHGAAA